MKRFLLPIIVIVLIIAGIVVFKISHNSQNPQTSSSPQSSPSPTQASPTSTSTVSNNALAYPIADFKDRITKKPFGVYITPQNSPVQPEKFTGYHTGTDIEYQDVSSDVPVFALNDGTITYSNYVSGYGGVLIIKVDINGSPHSVLYGHLQPSSLPAVGTTFKKGDQMAVLGTGYSNETNGERRHLHFSVLSNDRIDLKGYVKNKADLSGWIDPVSLYNYTK